MILYYMEIRAIVKEPLSRSAGCFSEGQEQIVGACQKAQLAIREGNRNPLGLELLSAAAERGITVKTSPTETG